MGIEVALKRPKLSGVCVITRKGAVVGTIPSGTVLPARLAKVVEEREKQDEHPSDPEDPF